MKKVFSFIFKLLITAIVGLYAGIVILAILIGVSEGDLSHGLWYYFQ